MLHWKDSVIFEANKIEEDSKKRAILPSSVGTENQ